ncbi:MAG: cytidylate kinase-like family protein [Lachnospiraceae bacterium]|nr:cytidylate kinase-like family protein [Lachnospiraceae bacterium]
MANTVITIARGYGSGGRQLGIKLSDKLGIPYYDKDLIKKASEESGISEALFGESDEMIKKKPLFGIFKKKQNDGRILDPGDSDFTSEDNIFNYQAKIIRDLAESESCIIIGRCADYVLRDYENVIKLFFYAPFEDCIDRVIDVYGGTAEEAKKKIAQVDNYRARYYKYHTGRDWNDSRNYDFCLNTGSMSYDKLIEIVTGYIDIKNK